MTNQLNIFPAAICLWVGVVTSVGAGQKVVVGLAVPPNQQISMDRVDHSLWHQLLQKYVNEKGQVDYKAWKASSRDRQALDKYLNTLSTASAKTRASRNAQLAFWINSYNAVTIKGILREYPTSSIRNHTANGIGYNLWKDLLLIVGDTKISLNYIEHEILRKMDEPRIHFAIVCASHSCPRLLNQSYSAATLEAQLVANTKAFFADPQNFRHDVARRKFHLSAILKWFKTDFGSDQAAQLKSIAPYLPTKTAYDAALQNTVGVSYLKYNWSLNEQKKDKQASGSGSRR